MGEIDHWRATAADRTYGAEYLESSRLMYPMISVDPGDTHVGVAVWDMDDMPGPGPDDPVNRIWICQDAFETRPVPLLRALQVAVGSGLIQTVVFERFVLEPAGATACLGTDMETAQMIGAIKFAVNGRCEIIGQTNQIKIPIRSVLKARKLKSRARLDKAGGHAFDAELHGAYHIIHTLGETITND